MLAIFEEVEEAAETVSAIISEQIIPATLEFIDKGTLEVVEEYAQIGLPVEAGAVLLIEQDGPEEVVKRDMERLAQVCEFKQANEIQIAATIEEGLAEPDTSSCGL